MSCIVAEYELSDGDSFELADALAHTDVPIVIYTASGTESLAAKAVTAPIDDYIIRDPSTENHDALIQSLTELDDESHQVSASRDVPHQQAIVETMQDGAFVLDTDSRVQYVNPRIEEITGYSADSLRGKEFKSLVEVGLFPPTEYERYQNAVDTACREGTTEILHIPFVDADKGKRVFELILSPIVRRDSIVGVVGIPRDVTDRELADTQRTELLSRMTDAFFALDDEWRFTYINEQARQTFSQVTEPSLGEKIWKQYPDAIGGVFYEKYHEAMEAQEPVTFETYAERYDSWFEVRAYPSLSGISVFFRDITDRKQNLQELEKTNDQLEAVLQNLPVVLFAVDTEGIITLSEGAGLEELGRDPGELVGKSVFEAYSEIPEVQNNIQRALEGTPVDFRVEIGDIVYDSYFQPTFDDVGSVSGVIGVATDVTDTAHLKDGLVGIHSITRELLVAEDTNAVATTTTELLPQIVETSFVSLWVADEAGVLVPTGDTEERDEGNYTLDVSDDTDSPLVEAYNTGEAQLLHPEETAEHVVSAEPSVESVLEIPVGSQGVLVVGTEGTFAEADVELLDMFSMTLTSALLGAKRREELQSREAELAATNERLDDFVSVVAHDLRNPISIATGYLELAQETGDIQHLERVSKALDRMNSLIEDLL
ncbi:histidine kinase, partial [Haloferax profundi]